MSPPRSTNFAAIDVGSNAVRLKIARRRATGRLEPLHQQRDPIRPGEGVFSTGTVPRAAADRLIFTLREYSDLCRLHGARVRAVATSALREAHNRAELLARIRHEAGVELEIISGREEARLVCLGVLEGALPQQRSLCLDVGGGSTELAVALGESPVGLWSVPLGTVRLMERVGGVDERDQLARMRMIADDAAEALPAQNGAPLLEALGCSGTARALVEFATCGTRSYATAAELGRAVRDLDELGAAGRRRLFEPRRADVIVAGAAIVDAVMRRLNLGVLRAVKRGLRDGVLLDLVRATDRAAIADVQPPLSATASSTRSR